MYALGWTLGVFVLVLLLARFRVPLAAAILTGSVVLGLAFDMSLIESIKCVAIGVIQPKTLGLMVITALLLMVSGTMQAGGQMKRIVLLATALFRRPWITIAALPALIGLLPMPGGALFSAPMVESVAKDEKISSARLSAINYWFRHIWEQWWPLYPGVIMAVAISGIDITDWVPVMLPLGAASATVGLLMVRRTKFRAQKILDIPKGTRGAFIVSTSSIWLILLVWAAAKTVMSLEFVEKSLAEIPAIDQMKHFAPLGLGLLVSWTWTIKLNRLSGSLIRGVVMNKSILVIVALVAAVMIFQHVLDETDAASKIGQELNQLHVPVTAVIALLPFIAGAVTGIAVGFVGTSFPIVVALAPSDGPLIAYVALAYAFGHLGQLVSPLHLCYVVSNKYFKTTYAPVYREFLPSACILAVISAAYFVLLKTIMPIV